MSLCLHSALLFVLAVLLAKNCFNAAHIQSGDNGFEIQGADIKETSVDFKLLDKSEKLASLFSYSVANCAKFHEICYVTPFGPYTPCCMESPDIHCYCTPVNCYCSDNISKNGRKDETNELLLNEQS